MQEMMTTNWIGTREWAEATKGITFVSYVAHAGPVRLVGVGREFDQAQVTDEHRRPRNYLSSTDDPVLAKIWDNSDDDIYDSL